ncbi:hypothetical protein, partial [Leuconostoc mesenteroides]|uniref:hypothetical protein n=1 Tax=Leuconostoc mesenteroides TaxID=1245 RepID=UPI0023608DEB
MGNVAVYKKGTTDFFSQGLGLLSDVVSSNLTQKVSSTGNVGQKLEVEYPIDGYIVSELVEGAILRVSVSTDKSDYGVFEIVDTLKDDSGTITVYGDPYYNRILRMSFDNGGVFTKFSSVQSALNAAKQNITGFPADFNLTSNLNTSVDLSENTYDTFGTFLEALNSAVHGNIKYSLNSIQIYSAIGKDITDITLRDDMNTSSVKITTDFSGIINKVIPVLPVLDKDGNATDKTKVGTIVISKYSNQFLDYWAGKVIQFDTQDLANTYFDRTKADRPVHTVDVDPIGLDDDFSTINIFDTIELYSTRLDYTDKLRVSERVFDTLSENVTSFKLGSSSVNIFNQINEQNNEIFNNVVKLTNAAISANGKGIDYFGQAKPSSPKEGNTWFWDDGTDFGIKQYTNGEWVDLAGSNTQEKIEAAVTDAVTQAKSHTDEVKQGLSSDIATAKSQAASLANAAEANAKSEATSLFSTAQNALSEAKTDLTKSIASEASQAVAAANSQAQAYVNQAKSDINDTINALSVGGRNLLLGTATPWTVKANDNIYNFDSIYDHLKGGTTYTFSAEISVSNGQDSVTVAAYDAQIGTLWASPYNFSKGVKRGSFTFTTPDHIDNDGHLIVYAGTGGQTAGLSATYTHMKLEEGNVPTAWTPAPEDVVLDYTTKDNKIKETITQYQNTNDGKVSKAQTDATTALGLVATKISQTDYNQKNGELSHNINEAKDTADKALRTIGDYKTSNDKRVEAAESSIERTARAITEKVSQTYYDNNNSQLNTRFTKVETTANGTATTVSNLQQTVNSLGQTNLINNSEFSPDLQGWSMTGSGTYTTGDYDHYGAVLVLANTGGGIVNLYSSPISLNGSSSMTISWKLNYYIFSVGTNGSSYIYLQYLDSSLNPIPNVFVYPQNVAGSSGKGWTNYIVENFTLTNMPAGAKYIRLGVDAREKGSKIGINKPMLTLGTSVGAYVQGNYNNNAALAQVKKTADSISNFVRDSSGNISSNFQTALSKTSIITGSTLATSIQTQTSSQISSALTDNNGKIISLINQDTSGVQIAGKNIVLNGDTTVTGTFKVSQANIANGAIGTAQIGDAAITNAKIANLDVSKITGNVTNFIQSYWNGVYGSTTITSSGMKIVSPGTVALFN